MGASGIANGANVSISTVRASFPDALRFAAEILQRARFPGDRIRADPPVRASRASRTPAPIRKPSVNAHCAATFRPIPKATRAPPSTVDEEIDELKKLTLADVKKFYADFYGASNAELAIVGDFDAAEVQKLATELFGAWKSPAPSHSHHPRLDEARDRRSLHRNPGQNQRDFPGHHHASISDDDPDYSRALLADTILGGGEGIAPVGAHARKRRPELPGGKQSSARARRKNSRTASASPSATRRTS